MPCYLTFKISPTYSVKWSELFRVLDTHPAEVQSHPRGHGPADGAELAPVHCQPVLARGGAVEVVLQLRGKGGLWLVAVQPTPVLITAAKSKRNAQISWQRLCMLLRYHLILQKGIIY